MQVPGFEPGLKAWKAFVLPGYTTPAYRGGCINYLYIKVSKISLTKLSPGIYKKCFDYLT